MKAKVLQGYGRLPLAFEANQGQTDARVKFLSRGAGYTLFLTPSEAVVSLGGARRESKAPMPGGLPSRSKESVLHVRLLGGNADAEVAEEDALQGRSNYFIGNDPKKWHANVPQYGEVRYKSVYPGVDLVYYGNHRELEYDFVLQPGADPASIRLGIEGATRRRLEHGDLVLTSAAGDVRLRSPHIYQERDGVRQKVHGGYVIRSKNEVGFRLEVYDRRRALVIDPVLVYSTYLGGSGGDGGEGIAVDAAGNAYVTGFTGSIDFPVAKPLQSTNHGQGDVFVTKFNAEGTALIYSTYLGGSSDDSGLGIALDSAGNAYITGQTGSTDFPTVNAIQPAYGGSSEDGFVTKIRADGTALLYSTYLGGSGDDSGSAIAVDAGENVYVTGATRSQDFPTANAFQSTNHGEMNAFVTKIKPDGTGFVFSTYLGGSADDAGTGIKVDSQGNIYLGGWTSSADFPIANAIQPTNHGLDDAFVTKISSDGKTLDYSTYLGGSSDDNCFGIAIDSAGNAYVTGKTISADFPTANALQPTYHGTGDAFVTKINATGSAVVFSTYLGGSGFDGADGIAVDSAGNAYVTGGTESPDFPTINAIQPKIGGRSNAFVTEINAAGNALEYSTYLGGKNGSNSGLGIALHSSDSTYIVGTTASTYFPISPVGFQQLLKGGTTDAFITKIASRTLVSVSPASVGFYKHVIGTTSATKKVMVKNNGSGTLTIREIFIGGLDPADFAETNTCGASLAAGAACTVSVTFTATAKGTRTAGLGISSSDPGSPSAIPLSGIGTVVSLSQNSLSFGDQAVGTSSASQNVTLTNTGNTQLNFKGISITGTNAADFNQTNTCGSSIAAHANCTITVTFKPTAIGKRTAAVTIKDDGGGSPQSIALTGTGT